MKFGKALETNAESMPEDWRPYVIHYKALKKRISTIVKELDDRGLPSPTIKNLLSQSMNGDAHRLEYTFDEDKQHLKACIKVVFDNLEPNLTDSGESSPVPLSPDEQLSRILAHELNLQNNSVYSLSSTSDSDDRISKKTNSLVDLLDDDPTAFYSSESDPSSPRLPTTRIVDNNGDEVNNENEVDNENEVNNEVSNENDHQINNQTLNSILHGPKTEEITQTLGAKSISQPLISSQPSEVTPTLDPSSTSEESENMETLVTPGAMHQQQSVMGISTESTLFNQSHSKVQTSFEDGKRVLVIELPADTAFFDQLGDEISNLSKLQQANKHGFESKVEDLSKILTHVSSPHNKDMYTWREILRIYLEAQVFVGDQEADRSTRSSEKAEKQLQWFMTEMDRSKLTQKFKLSKSKVAFTTFFQLNSELIRMKQFRELNHMAMTKILKKHDKRTNLSASSGFPKYLQNEPFYNDNISRSLTYTIGNQLISVIPQPDDYSCPICMSVAWKPIRLRCKHVFCVRCLIKAQRKNMDHCPVCRESESVKKADASNLDVSMMNFMKLYFPKEINEKRKESSREQAMEEMEAITGRRWTEADNQACIIM